MDRPPDTRPGSTSPDGGEGWSYAAAEGVRRLDVGVRSQIEAIAGAARLLLSGDLTSEQRTLADAVEAAADTALSTLADVLDVTSNSGVVEVPFRPADLVREAVRGCRGIADQRRVRLTVGVLDALPGRLVGDPGRIRRALVHLIRDSVSAVSPGRVQVAARVEDQGDGMLFRLAVRCVGAIDHVEGGTEEWVAARLVQSLGGVLDRRRSANEMTSSFAVVVSLPTASEHHNEPVERGRRILVIADDLHARRSLVEGLSAAGFDADAVGGLQDVPPGGDRPGLVVLAPADAPFEAARAVLSAPQLGGIPVLLIVSHGERGDAVECLRLGIAGYLPEPISPVDLADAARLLLGGTEPEALVTRHHLRERRRPLSLLVADDSPTARATLIRALEDLGHEVLGAATGKEAVEITLLRQVDAVLMSVDLPGTDGIEATRRIRAAEPAHTRIIGISAHAFSDDRGRCLEAGMDEQVAKPIRIEQIHRLLDPSAFVSS